MFMAEISHPCKQHLVKAVVFEKFVDEDDNIYEIRKINKVIDIIKSEVVSVEFKKSGLDILSKVIGVEVSVVDLYIKPRTLIEKALRHLGINKRLVVLVTTINHLPDEVNLPSRYEVCLGTHHLFHYEIIPIVDCSFTPINLTENLMSNLPFKLVNMGDRDRLTRSLQPVVNYLHGYQSHESFNNINLRRLRKR